MSEALINSDEGDLQARVYRNRVARMAEIDRQPPEIRALIHDYGWHVIKTLMDSGVKKPRAIKHIVETILDEFSPTRGSYSKQGIRTDQD